MRLKSQAELQTMLNKGSISESAAKQVRRQFSTVNAKQPVRRASGQTQKRKFPIAPLQSEGEAVLGIALRAHFGHWHDGGEVVEELVVFPSETQIRVDYALPRWQVYIEIEGWTHHGRSIDDHHADRDRLNFLASRNWHRFAVTHWQATKAAMTLVEKVEACLSLREEIAREHCVITCRDLLSGQHWHDLTSTKG